MSKILIIEDDLFLLSLIVEKFIKSGFEVETAVDGEEGLNKILKNRYDLVLLDMILPKMDGFKVLEEVKKNQSLKELPIIVASNLYDKNDIDRAVSLGAKDYIVKAYNSPEGIIIRVKAFLQKNLINKGHTL
ncbi:MAG: response regulator [Patescibacteria group bacterium]|nr:response regulator [Patescibacteria group bacterium]MDE1988383.1 response regulator [Patescibacteria group bacterium]MDE2217886.1 response regulator [Patescibacteria group bacterium]